MSTDHQKLIIDLKEIADCIEMSNLGDNYLNTRTGEIVYLPSDDGMMDDYRDAEDELDEHWEDYVQLPTQYDVDSFGIMRDFIYNLPQGQAREALYTAIKGRGAFRRFKDVCYNFGLEQEWYAYKDERYLEFAKEWCKENNLSFSDSIHLTYTRLGRNDMDLLIAMKKKELDMDADDESIDFELERYFAAQLKQNNLYQVAAMTKAGPVATGAIQWIFQPPTPENTNGRLGMLVNFWIDEQKAKELPAQSLTLQDQQMISAYQSPLASGQPLSNAHVICQEILIRLLAEAKRRNQTELEAVSQDELLQDVLLKSGFVQVNDTFAYDNYSYSE